MRLRRAGRTRSVVDGTGFGEVIRWVGVGFHTLKVQNNCVGTGFRDMEQVFYYVLWVTNRYGNRPTK